MICLVVAVRLSHGVGVCGVRVGDGPGSGGVVDWCLGDFVVQDGHVGLEAL